MKIVSISMVKNESDIIESFVRYTLNIVDEMIILDNGSTDETPQILDCLIKENLPITLIHDDDRIYNQDKKTTKLLHKAVNEFDADLVCILDADEFLASENGENPRLLLETINLSYYYLIKVFNYIPTAHDDYNIKFIPKRITHVGKPNKKSGKIIVSKNIVKNYKVNVVMGNHDLIFKGNKNTNLLKTIPNLYIAHFPIRSKEQCMSKILLGWPNIVAAHTINTDYGYHWRNLFNKIKKQEDISFDDLEYFTKIATNFENPDTIATIKQPMDIDFCNNIEMKYIYPYNYLSNILEGYVNLADEYAHTKIELDLKSGNASIIEKIKMKLIDIIL